MKKAIVRLLAVLLCIAIFTGCAEKKEDSDLAYIQDKGTLVVGITDFAPMDYKDAGGNWIGFDADMAAAFANAIGVDVEFVEINWDNKVLELNGKNIDCVWNGMTLTDEVLSAMECSNAYCNNAQVVVLPVDKADKYQTIDSLNDLVFACEAGSAGESEVTALGLQCTPVSAQTDAMMEVAAGTSDAAAIDALIAAAMVGEGTGYENLTYTISLNSEEYGVGFRKGSDMAETLNQFFGSAYLDGSMIEIAENYGVQAALIDQNTVLENSAGTSSKEHPFKAQFPIVLRSLNVGFLQTLKLFAITLIGALPLGLLISFGSMSAWAPFYRLSRRRKRKVGAWDRWARFLRDFKPISLLIKTVVWIVRGSPLMLQLLIIYYFPGLVMGQNIWGSGEGGRFLASAIAFIVNYACYFSEIFRGGIQGVPSGQDEAGLVLGMTKSQIFFKVKLMQMIKRIVPPMGNEFITLIKDTSLSRIIALQELIWAGQAFLKGSQGISGVIWPLFFTGLYYLIFTGILTLLLGWVEKKLNYFRA